MMSMAGFGSLLSIDSARSTFPDLRNFRMRRVRPHCIRLHINICMPPMVECVLVSILPRRCYISAPN